MPELIAIISKSPYDYAELRRRVGSRHFAVNCDEPSVHPLKLADLDDAPLLAARVLVCIYPVMPITPHIVKLTSLYGNKGYSSVIGTHTYPKPPTEWLQLEQLSGITVVSYSTALRQYAFVNGWSKELAKPEPNKNEIRTGFDRFIAMLRAKPFLDLIDEIKVLRHKLVQIIDPLILSLQAWAEEDFDIEAAEATLGEYASGEAAKVFEEVREAIYPSSHSSRRTILEIGCEMLVDSTPVEFERLNDQLKVLVPPSKEQQLETLEFLQSLGERSSRADLARSMNELGYGGDPFQQWWQEIYNTLQDLEKEVGTWSPGKMDNRNE